MAANKPQTQTLSQINPRRKLCVYGFIRSGKGNLDFPESLMDICVSFYRFFLIEEEHLESLTQKLSRSFNNTYMLCHQDGDNPSFEEWTTMVKSQAEDGQVSKARIRLVVRDNDTIFGNGFTVKCLMAVQIMIITTPDGEDGFQAFLRKLQENPNFTKGIKYLEADGQMELNQ